MDEDRLGRLNPFNATRHTTTHTFTQRVVGANREFWCCGEDEENLLSLFRLGEE